MLGKIFSLVLKLLLIFLLLLYAASHLSHSIHSFAAKFVAAPVRNLYSAVCNILPIPLFEILAVAVVVIAPFIVWRFLFGKGRLTLLTTAIQLVVIGYIITVGIDGAIPIEDTAYEPTEAEMVTALEKLSDELAELSPALPDRR